MPDPERTKFGAPRVSGWESIEEVLFLLQAR
jgi:hypothetical protein